MFFDDVRVPSSAILGGEAGVNRGFGMLMGELPRERLLIGIQACATMEAAYEFTKEYVKERKAFGRTVVSFFVALKLGKVSKKFRAAYRRFNTNWPR